MVRHDQLVSRLTLHFESIDSIQARYVINYVGMHVNQSDGNLLIRTNDVDYSMMFHAEIECCATTLWTIIGHLMTIVNK
jgi:hypothetical protein